MEHAGCGINKVVTLGGIGMRGGGFNGIAMMPIRGEPRGAKQTCAIHHGALHVLCHRVSGNTQSVKSSPAPPRPAPPPLLVPLAHKSSLFYACIFVCVRVAFCLAGVFVSERTLPVMKRKRAILPRIIGRPTTIRAGKSSRNFPKWIVRRNGLATCVLVVHHRNAIAQN